MQDGLPNPQRRLSLSLGLGGLAVAAALPATANAQAASGESRLETVIKRGKIIVATSPSSPPLTYMDNGAYVGFDIDIAKIIAHAIFGDSEKIEFQSVDGPGRWPAVLSGRADFGIGGTTVYPDRALRVAFTSRVMDSSQSILVRKDSKIKSLDDLNSPSVTVANLSNPQMADRAKKFFPKAALLTFDTGTSQMLALKSGQAQAMQTDTPVLDWYARNDDTLEVLPTLLGNVQNNAIFMKPGDFTWWKFLDTTVEEMLTGSRYTEYTATFQKWFGRNPPPARSYPPR